MMNPLPWFKLRHDMPEDQKCMDLAERSGDLRAWTHVVELLIWVSRHRPTGCLSGVPVTLIGRYAGRTTDAKAFGEALYASGWIDRKTHMVAEWDDMQGALVRRFEADRTRKAKPKDGGSVEPPPDAPPEPPHDAPHGTTDGNPQELPLARSDLRSEIVDRRTQTLTELTPAARVSAGATDERRTTAARPDAHDRGQQPSGVGVTSAGPRPSVRSGGAAVAGQRDGATPNGDDGQPDRSDGGDRAGEGASRAVAGAPPTEGVLNATQAEGADPGTRWDADGGGSADDARGARCPEVAARTLPETGLRQSAAGGGPVRVVQQAAPERAVAGDDRGGARVRDDAPVRSQPHAAGGDAGEYRAATGSRGGDGVGAPSPTVGPAKPVSEYQQRKLDVDRVWAHYERKISPIAKPNFDRLNRLEVILKGNLGCTYTADELIECIEGYATSDFWMGRGTGGEFKASFENIFMKPGGLDKGREMFRERKPKAAGVASQTALPVFHDATPEEIEASKKHRAAAKAAMFAREAPNEQ